MAQPRGIAVHATRYIAETPVQLHSFMISLSLATLTTTPRPLAPGLHCQRQRVNVLSLGHAKLRVTDKKGATIINMHGSSAFRHCWETACTVTDEHVGGIVCGKEDGSLRLRKNYVSGQEPWQLDGKNMQVITSAGRTDESHT
eukprot:1569525-Amphidinium_carterae.2